MYDGIAYMLTFTRSGRRDKTTAINDTLGPVKEMSKIISVDFLS